ncbi:serine hydrolase domain-containing protein [Paenibacillus hodogayensis]|uniref:Serine hydrolase domain-containing protein n=1 Tax=Paenibacillus hodogayensis TaxID=279208 RepID=A0ABV5W354_9BACL
MSPLIKKVVALIALLTLLFGGAWMFAPQTRAAAPVSSTPERGAADLNDATALSAFIDDIMKTHMDSFTIPGAVISIVKDGKPLFAKGYGHSDIAVSKPVDPETSLFRIASTTKLFTWTAVMQLVEQGKIDLDADVNTYLKTLTIPQTYPQPITMRHLMTHTAGFEEGGVGYQITTDSQKLPGSISDTLAKHMLKRVRPPGEMAAYSNYGASLAGLIVEEVSGLSYNDYVQTHIFDTLGMKYATVHEPVPARLQPFAVTGYSWENGRFATKPATYEGGFRPAGSGTVSALDMARFMIAHLQNGQYGSNRILKPETARLMHSPAFQFDPRLPGMDLGFYELNMNGQRVISHGGADPLFITELYLVPEQQIGLFVSYSGGDGGAASEGLSKAFFDRYFPVREGSVPPVSAELEKDVEKYAGSYQFTRRNHSHIDKFFSMMSQFNIKASGNRLSLGSGAEQQLYAPIGPNLFQEVGGAHQIGFRTDSSGKVTHMALDFLSYMPLERTPLLDRSQFWYALLGISGILFLSALSALVVCRRRIKTMPKPQKRAIVLSAVASGWALATCVATVVIVLGMDTMERLSGIPLSLHLYLVMPLVLVGLTIVLIGLCILGWVRRYWTLPGRVHYTLVALSAAGTSLFFYHWNLLGWHFG